MSRTALLIRCYTDEADRIRNEARRRHTTISSYVVQVLSSTIHSDEQRAGTGNSYEMRRGLQDRSSTPRTAILLRCDDRDAERIRDEARKNSLAINRFVLQSLKRVWQV